MLDLVEADAELECIGSGFTFTEGPVWTNRDGGSLLFSDMPGDTRRRWTQAGGVEVLAHPSNKGNGLSYDLEGRLLICEHSTSSLIRVEPDGSRTVLASHWQGKELNSPNDVVVTADGSIVFTDPPYGRWPGFGVEREQELDFCGVYRVAPDGELLAARRRLPEAQRPVLLARREDALDQRHRRRAHPPLLGRLRRLAERRRGHLPDGGASASRSGIPDGQKLDANGNLWVSGPGGLHVVTGEGELLGRILTPENVGNQAWGGEDWKTLFICTSSTVHTLRTKVAAHRTPTMN